MAPPEGSRPQKIEILLFIYTVPPYKRYKPPTRDAYYTTYTSNLNLVYCIVYYTILYYNQVYISDTILYYTSFKIFDAILYYTILQSSFILVHCLILVYYYLNLVYYNLILVPEFSENKPPKNKPTWAYFRFAFPKISPWANFRIEYFIRRAYPKFKISDI